MSERTGSRTAQLEQSPTCTYKDHKNHLVNSNLRRTAYYKRLEFTGTQLQLQLPFPLYYNTLGMDESDPLITHPMTGRGKFQE